MRGLIIAHTLEIKIRVIISLIMEKAETINIIIYPEGRHSGKRVPTRSERVVFRRGSLGVTHGAHPRTCAGSGIEQQRQWKSCSRRSKLQQRGQPRLVRLELCRARRLRGVLLQMNLASLLLQMNLGWRSLPFRDPRHQPRLARRCLSCLSRRIET